MVNKVPQLVAGLNLNNMVEVGLPWGGARARARSVRRLLSPGRARVIAQTKFLKTKICLNFYSKPTIFD